MENVYLISENRPNPVFGGKENKRDLKKNPCQIMGYPITPFMEKEVINDVTIEKEEIEKNENEKWILIANLK